MSTKDVRTDTPTDEVAAEAASVENAVDAAAEEQRENAGGAADAGGDAREERPRDKECWFRAHLRRIEEYLTSFDDEDDDEEEEEDGEGPLPFEPCPIPRRAASERPRSAGGRELAPRGYDDDDDALAACAARHGFEIDAFHVGIAAVGTFAIVERVGVRLFRHLYDDVALWFVLIGAVALLWIAFIRYARDRDLSATVLASACFGLFVVLGHLIDQPLWPALLVGAVLHAVFCLGLSGEDDKLWPTFVLTAPLFVLFFLGALFVFAMLEMPLFLI